MLLCVIMRFFKFCQVIKSTNVTYKINSLKDEQVIIRRKFKWNIQIHITTQNVILTFFSQPTWPPLKILNVENAKCNTNPLMNLDTLKMFCLLIFKRYRILPSQRHVNKTLTAKHYHSFPKFYHSFPKFYHSFPKFYTYSLSNSIIINLYAQAFLALFWT